MDWFTCQKCRLTKRGTQQSSLSTEICVQCADQKSEPCVSREQRSAATSATRSSMVVLPLLQLDTYNFPTVSIPTVLLHALLEGVGGSIATTFSELESTPSGSIVITKIADPPRLIISLEKQSAD